MANLFTKLPLLLGSPASGTAGGSGSMVTTFVTFGLVILIFYFLIIRPQNKKQKETKRMLSALKKGDKVVSIGGIHGTVVAVKEQTTVVKVDDNIKLEFSKSAISSVVNEG
ncbi:MAG: preprotein translocase subunit YajC [Spirochaetales bacterium]|nr:preprotein translocase subunit YajC [Spirochaetales bacterium]